MWLLTEIAYKLLRSRYLSRIILCFLARIHRAKRLSVISLSILHQTLRDMPIFSVLSAVGAQCTASVCVCVSPIRWHGISA